MSVTEQDRRLLFERLSDVIGTEAATVLTELLPFQPSSELVTRDDMMATATLLRGEMAELRGEFVAFKGEMRGEFYRWGATVVAANAIAVITALVT